MVPRTPDWAIMSGGLDGSNVLSIRRVIVSVARSAEPNGTSVDTVSADPNTRFVHNPQMPGKLFALK